MYYEEMLRKGLPKKETCKPNHEIWEGTARLQVKEEFSENEKEGCSLWGQRFSWMFLRNWTGARLALLQWAWRERRAWNTSWMQTGRCTTVGAFRGPWASTSYFPEHCHWFYSCDSCISHGNPFEVGVAVLVLEVCKQKPVESHTFSKWQRHSKPGLF